MNVHFVSCEIVGHVRVAVMYWDTLCFAPTLISLGHERQACFFVCGGV